MKHQLTRRVVLSSALALCTLTALPVSVFAQATTTAATTSAPIPAASTKTVTPAPYPTDKITGKTAGDFVVGPGKIELSLEPGQSKTVEMTVTNRMGVPKWFKMSVEDVKGSMDPQQPVVLLGSSHGPYSVKDYLHIPQKEFELKNMERARIPVTVTLPADAEPGGHYGSILVSTVSKGTNGDIQNGAAPSSAVISRIGTLFFVSTPGSKDISGTVKSFGTVPAHHFFFSGPIKLGILFENTGSVHLDPYGEITITNLAGDQVGQIDLTPWFALPKSLRTREVTWDRSLLIGRYTATATIHLGYDNKVVTKTFTFWVIPWKFIGGTFLGLFFLFLIIRFLFTRFEFRRKG